MDLRCTALLASVMGQLGCALASAGILDHRIVDYYQSKITKRRPVLKRISRRHFMKPYSSQCTVRLARAGVLGGYLGTDLAKNLPMSRFEIAFLLGRFIRLVNTRDGTVFKKRKSRDHHLLWIPRKGWGLFDVEAALAERLFLPTPQPEFWERPLSRYSLAAKLGRLFEDLEENYELIRFFEEYPAGDFEDFVHYGHHFWFLCKRAIQYGLLDAEGNRFRGREHVRGHDMASAVERLLTIAEGYQREGYPRPWPPSLRDPSHLALPIPDPFPEALETIDRRFVVPTTRPRGQVF